MVVLFVTVRVVEREDVLLNILCQVNLHSVEGKRERDGVRDDEDIERIMDFGKTKTARI